MRPKWLMHGALTTVVSMITGHQAFGWARLKISKGGSGWERRHPFDVARGVTTVHSQRVMEMPEFLLCNDMAKSG